ncbi:DUF421 domain-containing protein [Corynebacterium sp. SCR221107]|uniref:DUF421 domain-containing protein n=1 Tax=Corynebacterium sp. SCR221107 TaxID=3017361 RepID=UPI0022EC56CB|nr:YetF domain-containing protein [Corynebacterium sp. SCR221107]WBT09165.1 DUF421 domain-containing protein [Corynebacterium sp. SCR221107]
MNEFTRLMWEQLAIEPWRIPVVMISAIGAYLGFLLLVRVFGVRVLAKMSSFDTVVIVMYGAVAGRVIIGNPPTLAAGIIGLLTLMGIEAVMGEGRRIAGLRRTFDTRPQVVMVHGKVVEDKLRRSHLAKSDLRLAIRRAGIPALNQVQLVILEPTGNLSIFREGVDIDPNLLRGVAGVDLLYP